MRSLLNGCYWDLIALAADATIDVGEVTQKHRTFAFSELAVHPSKRKQGISDALTRALFENRPEDLAVLLVAVTQPRVQSLYEDWGFKKVGERQPFPDSPVYAVMLAKLPLK
ncbi:GNAT family N-acetyltransferase [Streptomyces bauhiniae]|uniref:GNAT family N-acetyltransferase n=1 Tax=Streptomyces bauhiniae TaxID=2340725 RepID=A0A7K3QL13_9ACTN|nr:GNAT family N-acetyltransferase [Streptomyces bauhiniae]